MGQGEPFGGACGDRDRPVDPRRDDPVHLLGRGQSLHRRLVLDRDDRPSVGIAETRRGGVAIDGDHVQAALARRREQPELGRPRP